MTTMATMATTTLKTGFYGTDSETYYLTPAGRAWVSSVDFDGVREVTAVPAEATPLDGLMTPDECIDFCRHVEEESGERLIES